MGFKKLIESPNHIPKELPIWTMYLTKFRKETAQNTHKLFPVSLNAAKKELTRFH